MYKKIITSIVAFASVFLYAKNLDSWVPLQKGETVGGVVFEKFGSPYGGFTLWQKGGLVDQVFEASKIPRHKEKELASGTNLNLGVLYEYRNFKEEVVLDIAPLTKQETRAPPPAEEVVLNIAPLAKQETRALLLVEKPKSKHNLKLGIYSLHTELAADQTLSNGSGTSADEILSQVRLTASIDYRYKLTEKTKLHTFLLARWYQYSDSLVRNVRRDQDNVAFRFHLGLIHQASKRLKLGLNLFYDNQLFYFGDEVNPELFFELDTTAGVGAWAQIHAYGTKHIDFEPYLYSDYFTAFGDDVGSGFSIGAGIELPILKQRKFAFDLRYEQKFFDFFSSDIRHEILEIGLSYKL